MRRYLLNKKTVLSKNEKGFAEYMEIPYIEYNADGTVKCTGSEDFSKDRYKTLVSKTIYTATGSLNKGGYRMWKAGMQIVSNSNKEVRSIADAICKEEYQLRVY